MRETKNVLSDGDSRTDTVLDSFQDLSPKEKEKIPRTGDKASLDQCG